MSLGEARLGGVAIVSVSSAGSAAIASVASAAGYLKRYIWFMSGGCSSNAVMALSEAGTIRFQTVVNGGTTEEFDFPSPIVTAASNAVSCSTAVGGAASTFANMQYSYA